MKNYKTYKATKHHDESDKKKQLRKTLNVYIKRYRI